ncbi:MAG: Gfo/Idh/MocA family oxidoreductase [Pseudomonadota bacterium]
MTLNVCIVGAGIGAQHLTGFAALPQYYTVRSICDLDAARGRALASQYPGATYTADLPGVLTDTGIDLVDICLPPHLHFQSCMDALAAGKIVVCEKPLVPSLKEADALAEQVARTGGTLLPVFQYRYGAGMAQLRALIDAGLAGPCYAASLETHWNRTPDYYQIPWRGTWAGEEGGAILTHAIHIHDLVQGVLGPVARVYAELATRVNDIEVEDCAALTLRMENGALVTSSVTLGAAVESSRMRLMFQGFTVESDHAPYAPAAQPWRFTARAPRTQAQIDAVLSHVVPPPVGYAGLFAALAKALAGENSPVVTLDDARRSLEFVTATYASARSSLPVSLPLSADHPMYTGWRP